MKQKQIFKKIFIVAAIVLSVLPALVTFSAALTTLFNKMGWYVWLQRLVVPFEARLVAVLIKLVGIKAMVTPGESYAMVFVKPEGGTATGCP